MKRKQSFPVPAAVGASALRKAITTILFVALGTASFASIAGEPAKMEIQNGDTIQSILERQAGKPVKLSLIGGGELGGVVVKVNKDVVHLKELAGKEFYDAAVNLGSVGAVMVRTR